MLSILLRRKTGCILEPTLSKSVRETQHFGRSLPAVVWRLARLTALGCPSPPVYPPPFHPHPASQPCRNLLSPVSSPPLAKKSTTTTLGLSPSLPEWLYSSIQGPHDYVGNRRNGRQPNAVSDPCGRQVNHEVVDPHHGEKATKEGPKVALRPRALSDGCECGALVDGRGKLCCASF